MAETKKAPDDLLAEGHKAYQRCIDANEHNAATYDEDTRFSRLGDQWPEDIAKQRQNDGRPCLTTNKLPAFIRQVVNDARQNKPSIKVHPVDSQADPETADLMNGLIRNIEYSSNADVAYDTAVECAVGGGYGYFRIGLKYAYEDSFDLDITVDRVANPGSIVGDPASTAADSSDWNVAFVVERLSKEDFERQYGTDESKVDWDDTAWAEAGPEWLNTDGVLVAEWWTREQYDKEIVQLSDGSIRDAADLENDASLKALLASPASGLSVKRPRITKCWRVTQRFMSGAKILKTREWPGRYIPIVPVYGDEFFIGGKRYLLSLIHNAVDAQRQHNYWRTTATELVALAPRVPYIGRKGSFNSDIDRWNTANSKSHPFLEYDGADPPQRQQLDSGIAAGALQEALNAADDMKSIIGIYDASLGARSNETSGKAIMARQREGDVSTFHFIDNMARAIRHAGRIIIDLIPHAYDAARVVRVMGEDGTQEARPVNQQYQAIDPKTKQPMADEAGQPIMAMHDLTVGKYDLTVTTGPSYTTMRQETAEQMMQLIQAFPEAAPIIGDILVKNLDWKGADEIADRLKAMLPPQASGQPAIPPEVQQAIQAGKDQLAKYEQEIQTLRTDQSNEKQKVQNDFEIGQQKAANDYVLGLMKVRNDKAVQMAVNDSVETPNPDDPEGAPIVRSKADMGTEAIMKALAMLGQLISQDGQANRQALQQLATIMAAPNELVRDPVTNRAIGSRKVTH